MRTNRATPAIHTHECGTAQHIGPEQRLRRMALSALLFEDQFYQSGSQHAQALITEILANAPQTVAALAIEARSRMYLRHLPLFLIRELARQRGNGSIVANTLEQIIQRPDELTEYLALYWREKRQPVSAGSKRGLARAFRKFDAATLAKYNRDHNVKLRDVLRVVHSKPGSPEQSAVWKALIKGELASPDTWEVALSAGADKKETFERLLKERNIGGLAFLRNLRNMIGANVDPDLIRDRFRGGFNKVLPFRFVAAARYAPGFVAEIDSAMLRAAAELPRLTGTTIVLVDVSGSMDAPLSERSDMKRVDVAAGLAVLVRATAEHARIFTFSEGLAEVPAYSGLALVDAINHSQPHGSTYLGAAVTALAQFRADRLVVITDEQSHDRVPNPHTRGYLINVASYANGVCYGPWIHIDGWSERVLDFIHELEVSEGL